MTTHPTATDLFSPFTLGRIPLANRIVMSPMTRSRATGNVPNELMVRYYAQRAEAGLIITEGTAPSPNGLGYARIPGIFNEAQVAGWRAVTDAVHAEGSRIIVQLMHTGRVGHSANLPSGARLLGPSSLDWNGTIWTDEGERPIPAAEEMSARDVERTIQEFVHSAELAMEAGFDGVELHGANGYLIEQFLNSSANQRSDEWGGSVANRVRFAVQVAARTAEKIGAHRVGIRVSPYGASNGLLSNDDKVSEVHETLAGELGKLGLLYMHIVDHSALGSPEVPAEVKQRIRSSFGGPVILAGGYDRDRANADLAEGRGDLIGFARPFISNPRLVSCLRDGIQLAEPDFATFYTPGEEGYTDYPVPHELQVA